MTTVNAFCNAKAYQICFFLPARAASQPQFEYLVLGIWCSQQKFASRKMHTWGTTMYCTLNRPKSQTPSPRLVWRGCVELITRGGGPVVTDSDFFLIPSSKCCRRRTRRSGRALGTPIGLSHHPQQQSLHRRAFVQRSQNGSSLVLIIQDKVPLGLFDGGSTKGDFGNRLGRHVGLVDGAARHHP